MSFLNGRAVVRKESHLGKPASHGCVRLGIGPAKELYDWAPIGTRVVVVKPPAPVRGVRKALSKK